MISIIYRRLKCKGEGMEYIKIWNEIVRLFNGYREKEESKVQGLWENICCEFWGYRKLYNEIDTQRKIHLGSSERVVPDIILRKDDKDIAIIELKRGSLSSNEKYKQQLFSYLKQLKLNVGVLITNKIQLFLYDYKKLDSEQKCVEINFTIDNINGQKFIELFDRDNFNFELLKEFVEGDSKRKEEMLKLKSETIENKIKEILSDYYKNNGYNALVVDEFINGLSIDIQNNGSNPIRTDPHPIWPPISPSNYNLDKKEAIIFCQKNNIELTNCITFANLSSINGKYPANVKLTYLSYDWTIILNDGFHKKLHIFRIPANTFISKNFAIRRDNNKIVLAIDNNFVDYHHHQNIENRFFKYKINSIDY